MREFRDRVRGAIERLFGQTQESVEDEGLVYVKLRFSFGANMFVSAWFNAETGRIAFALVVGGKRVFGINNTGGWHLHPLEAPEEHRPIKPLTIEEALEKVFEAWRQIPGM